MDNLKGAPDVHRITVSLGKVAQPELAMHGSQCTPSQG
jgi:hypothetical protein